jgi:Ca-activated chloride channel homolog
MKPQFNARSRRLAQVASAVVLAGLLIYGAVGRASRKGPAGPAPVDTGWKSAGAVNVRANLSQTKVVQGSDGLVYLQVDLEAPNVAVDGRGRKPTDFVIVLDRSGSMADEHKMDYAKKAISSLINQLKEGDRFALIDFDSVVETPIPLTVVTDSSKTSFRASLDGIDPRNSTNIGGGLVAGIQTIQSAGKRSGQAQRLILLSDGLANEGITDPAELGRIAERAVSGEFAISTIGVGLDFNENLMSSLADHGQGNYTFLESLASLDKVLAQEFYGASRIYASGVRVALDLAPGIEATEAAGYPIEKEGATTVIHPGHLYVGQKKTLFVTLRLPTDTLYTRPLGSANVSYTVNGSPYMVALFGNELKVACLPPEKKDEAVASIVPGVFKEAWTQNNYGKLMKDSADQVKAGNQAGALSAIRDYRAKLSEAYAAAPAPEMKKQLDDLNRVEGEVNEAFSGPDAATKTKRLSKGYQYEGIQQQRTSK